MENNRTPVSKYALEIICTRLDRVIKRLCIALIICIVLMFASNALWLYAWMQYDYESETTTTTTETTYTQDGQGTNIIGDGNEVGHVADKENENHDNDPEAEADEEER